MSSSKREYIRMIQSVRIGDPLPPEFVPHRALREVLAREAQLTSRTSVIERNIVGMGWGIGPINYEMYIGDEEPEIPEHGPKRRIHWQPVLREDRPNGWGRAWMDFRIRVTGFATIADAPTPYYANWDEHARRHRNKWLRERETVWERFTPTLDQFLAGYKKAKMDMSLRYLFSSQLKDKVRVHGARVRLFAVRHRAVNADEAAKQKAALDGGMVAAFACIDAPEAKSSLHFISFIHESARKSPVGVGMMNDWFETSAPLGIKFLDFGVFWAQGDPSSWLGFSQFKSQFGIHFIRYPLALAKWVGSWWYKDPAKKRDSKKTA